MNQDQLEEEIQKRQREQQLRSMEADRSRAKSISVGNAGCGETEISMRGVDGTYLWNVYHPAEIVELIHQLAAAIGCHIAVKPREDFSSWREWRPVTQAEQKWLNGWAPFAQLEADGHMTGAGMLPHGRKFKQESDDGVATNSTE